MLQQKLLKRLVAALEAANVPYMAVGSIVSSAQGQARSTHDIDVVVQLSAQSAQDLAAQFPASDFFLDPVAMQQAIASAQMFNMLEFISGDKVDFWPLQNEPYRITSFARRYRIPVFGIELHAQRPEDTILSKLRWAEDCGGSEKQFGDALNVYELQYGVLDLDYMEHWARELEVDELWLMLKMAADVERP